MGEEAEALLHASKSMNKFLMSLLTVIVILIVSLVEWGVINAVVDGYDEGKFWVAILMDSVSLTLSFIVLGIYTKLPFTAVQILATVPFLLMIFFSTTFSPGSGVKGLKALRYLFARFYFWCMIPVIQDDMENCPADDDVVLYMVLAAFLGLSLFLAYQAYASASRSLNRKKQVLKQKSLRDDEFLDLQIEIYGDEAVLKHSESGTTRSAKDRNNSITGFDESSNSV